MQVAPSGERGLKFIPKISDDIHKEVAPSGERGLKLRADETSQPHAGRSLRGAWIEIELRRQSRRWRESLPPGSVA